MKQSKPRRPVGRPPTRKRLPIELGRGASLIEADMLLVTDQGQLVRVCMDRKKGLKKWEFGELREGDREKAKEVLARFEK